MAESNVRQRFARATRDALYATPLLMLAGWASPTIYGAPLPLPQALSAVVAIATPEMLIVNHYPPLQRELLSLAIGLGVFLGLVGLLQLIWPVAF
jgi:hypothetical protein